MWLACLPHALYETMQVSGFNQNYKQRRPEELFPLGVQLLKLNKGEGLSTKSEGLSKAKRWSMGKRSHLLLNAHRWRESTLN